MPIKFETKKEPIKREEEKFVKAILITTNPLNKSRFKLNYERIEEKEFQSIMEDFLYMGYGIDAKKEEIE